MSYEERLQAMIDKGSITGEQARHFAASLERLTPAGATLVFRKPVSLMKVSLSLMALLAAGTVFISMVSQPQSAANEAIQHVASAMNQPGSVGAMPESATSLLSLFILGAVPLALVLFFLAGLYNRLVACDEDIRKTAAFIQNAITNKQDLIPQLQALVQNALTYEETLQHSVAETRSTPAQRLQAALAEATTQPDAPVSPALSAVIEAYPQIRALENIGRLQAELARVEHNLLIARNIHAEAIADFNTNSRGVFGSLVAGMYGFRPQFQNQ